MKVNLFNCARDILNNNYLHFMWFRFLKRSLLFKSLILLLGICTGGLEAGTTYSAVTFTNESPSMPSNPGVYYAAYSFTAAGTANHTFTLSGAANQNNIIDATITIYSSSFDPLNPASNSPTDISSGGNISLISGAQYYAVVQSYADVYSLGITPSVLNQSDSDLLGASFSGSLKTKGNFTNTGASASVTASGTGTSGQAYVYAMDSTVANFTKSGNYNLVLLGQNQYTGSTTISAGTLSAAKNSIPSGSTINLSGGKLGAAASFTLPNAIVLNQDSTIDAQGQNLVLSGNVSGSYGLTITSSSGGGSVSLTGTNSYAGTTTVTSGKIKMSSSPNNAQIIFSGGSFQAAASFSMGNSVSVSSTTFDTDGNDIVLSGQLSGTSFTKTGGGMLSLSGTSNQHQGVMSVQAGILAIQSAGSLGDSSTDIALNGGSLKAIGAISGASGNSISVNVSGNIDTNGNAFDLLGSLTIISGVQLEVKDSGSGGVFDVSGSTGSSSAGTIKITGGTYRISDPAQMGTDSSIHILNGGTLKISNSTNFDASTAAKTLQALSVTDNSSIDTDAYTVRMVNPITVSSGKSFTKKGSGKMVFSAANTFAGPIVVDAGELDVSNIATQLAGATSLKLGNGATLTISGGGALPPLVL